MKNLVVAILLLLLSGCVDHFTVPSKEALQHPFPPLRQSVETRHSGSDFSLDQLENEGIAIIGILKGGPETQRQNAAFELFQGLRSFFPEVHVVPRKDLMRKIRAAERFSDYQSFLRDYETGHFMDTEKLRDWGSFSGVRYLFIGQVTTNDKHTATRTMRLAEDAVGGKISASPSGPAHIPYDVEKKITIRGEVWDSLCGEAIWIGTSRAYVKEKVERERVRVEDIFTMATRSLIGAFDDAMKTNSNAVKSTGC